MTERAPNVHLEKWVARIDAALPQTQCTRCGFPDCHSYAQAIADGEAGINQCPPGGAEGVARLAQLTGQVPVPLNPDNGREAPLAVAVIDENWCIGCTLCMAACPTDAIVGTHKRMHTVLEDACTGCDLCVPVCPVDCIEMVNVSGGLTGWSAWTAPQAEQARHRYLWHRQRTVREEREHTERQDRKAQQKLADLASYSKHTEPDVLDRKRAVIEAAMVRARAKRG